MRITGGKLCGRRVAVPKGDVRPTQDRIRESLFGILAGRVVGCRFLDLFAGSGIVGLEAWSRGAVAVVWVEQNRRVLRQLRETVATLCGSTATVLQGDGFKRLDPATAGGRFDIVFADPPYRATRRGAGGDDRIVPLLRVAAQALSGEGILVLERPAGPLEAPDGWNVFDERAYGDTTLTFLQQEETT